MQALRLPTQSPTSRTGLLHRAVWSAVPDSLLATSAPPPGKRDGKVGWASREAPLNAEQTPTFDTGAWELRPWCQMSSSGVQSPFHPVSTTGRKGHFPVHRCHLFPRSGWPAASPCTSSPTSPSGCASAAASDAASRSPRSSWPQHFRLAVRVRATVARPGGRRRCGAHRLRSHAPPGGPRYDPRPTQRASNRARERASSLGDRHRRFGCHPTVRVDERALRPREPVVDQEAACPDLP